MKWRKNCPEQRQLAAIELEQAVTSRMTLLGMEKGVFKIAMAPAINTTPATEGLETVEFLVSTNPGQPPRSLAKVASGGELSRISLAIQVVTAQTSHTPTLVFDEVDVGIGGATAEIVGSMLQETGARGQVLCVTHQPQVASQGHHHFYVNKKVTGTGSVTHITSLSESGRVHEIARMLGGVEITQSSLVHAREMLGENVLTSKKREQEKQ